MWILGPVLFLVLVVLSVSGTADLNITAEPGDDVTLPCRITNINLDLTFEWTRTDLNEDEYVFFYRSTGPFLEYQHESFRNRVFLNNSQMTDGDLSVVLKNLKTEDSGTYECRVLKGLSADKTPLISSIHLQVSPPPPGKKGGQEGENEDDGTAEGISTGVLAGIIVVVVFASIVVIVVLWIYKKRNCSKQSSGGSNNHQNPECDSLNSTSQRNTENIKPLV